MVFIDLLLGIILYLIGQNMGNALCSDFTSKQNKIIAEHRLLFKTLGFSRSDKRALAKAFFGADVDFNRNVSFREFT